MILSRKKHESRLLCDRVTIQWLLGCHTMLIPARNLQTTRQIHQAKYHEKKMIEKYRKYRTDPIENVGLPLRCELAVTSGVVIISNYEVGCVWFGRFVGEIERAVGRSIVGSLRSENEIPREIRDCLQQVPYFPLPMFNSSR